jgi:branched-chain amino acid transport system permease protein
VSEGVGWLMVFAALFAGTWVLKGYALFLVGQALAYMCCLLGLTIITGRGRMVTVGHGAFFAIGAYTAAILIARLGVPYPAAIGIAALGCFGLGYCFALPAVRLERHNLAIATLALAMSVPLVAKRFSAITGGAAGIMLPGLRPPAGIPVTAAQWQYLFSLGCTLVCFAIALCHVAGHRGRILTALADNELSAAATGINVNRMKAYYFAVGTLLAGAAGALSAMQVLFVNPDSYGLGVSIAFLTAAVICGASRLAGALLGGVFLIYAPTLVRALSANGAAVSPDLIYGVLLIVVLFILPDGLASVPSLLTRAIRQAPLRRRPPEREAAFGNRPGH